MECAPEVHTVSISIRPQMTPIGPVHVRMTGVVRGDQKGPGIGIVNAPTAAEATAELHRVARVSGADKVVSVAADYRRAALAGGTTATQWRIEVQAWGTAMAPAKPEASDAPQADAEQESRKQDSEKARDADAARKAQDGAAKADAATMRGDSPQPDKAAAPVAPPDPVEAAPAPAAEAPSAPEPAPATPAPIATSER